MKKLFLLWIFFFITTSYSQQTIRVFNNTERDSIVQVAQDSLLGDNWVTPEMYGADNTGIQDASVGIKNAIEAAGLTEGALYTNRRVLFTGEYALKDTITVDLNGANVELFFLPGSKLVSTVDPVVYDYYSTHGVMSIRDGGKITIRNMEFELVKATKKYQADNGLVIESCDEVLLENVSVKYAGYAGIRVQNVDNLMMNNCTADSNMYAGFMGVGVKHGVITGGSYSYNGDRDSMSYYGYGITFAYQFGTGLDNGDITISGVQANYNYRKPIDIHDGLDVVITGNHIKGFGYGAIAAVNEDGLVNNVKRIKDVIVADNIIANDSSWYYTNVRENPTTVTVKNDPQHIISVGSYTSDDNGGVQSSGTAIVKNNIIDCDNVDTLRAAIIAFVNKIGYPMENIQITGNTIINLRSGYKTYAGIMVLGDPTTFVLPKSVDISNNRISGTAPYGVYVAYGRDIKINDNSFYGTFSVPVASICETCLDSTKYTRRGNMYNNNEIPDMVSESQYFNSDRYAGNVKAFVTTSTAADSVNILKINLDEYKTAYGYPAGDNTFTGIVTVTVAKSGRVEPTAADTFYNGTFQGMVRAGKPDSAGTRYFVGKVLEKVNYSAIELTAPTAFWMGTDSIRYLRITCPDSYASYFINVDFSAWRLSPTILEVQSEIDSSGGAESSAYMGNTSVTERLEEDINQLATIETVDGWYEQNIKGQKEAPFTITVLSRGVGNMDEEFDLSGNATLRKLGARVDSDIDGEITVYLYKNGYNTGASVVLNDNYKEVQSFDADICSFTADDYFDLRWKYYDYGTTMTPSIKAWAVLAYPTVHEYEYYAQSSLTLTAMAVDSGQVAYFRIVDGAISDSNATTLTAGDYICAVARPKSGFEFVVWTGMPFNDETYRNNDTAYFYMPSNSQTLRARFRKATKTYAIIISDPCTEIDSAHAKAVRTALLLGNSEENMGDLTADSILIYKEGNLVDGESYRIADNYGADVVVRSTTGASSFTTIAQKYYPTMTFVPTSSNTYMEAWNTQDNLPCMILTGASMTADTNVTAYDIEWHGYNVTGTASYANGYIAGAMYAVVKTSIATVTGWHDWYGMRKVTRDYYSPYTAKNGYGEWIPFTTWDLDLDTDYDLGTRSNAYYYLQIDPYLQR